MMGREHRRLKFPGDRDCARDSADGRWLRRRCIAIRFGPITAR